MTPAVTPRGGVAGQAPTEGGSVGAYLVKGDNPTITGEVVRSLVEELVGGADAALVVEDFSSDSYELSAVIDAAHTPAFFGDHRVVVARQVGRFSTGEASALVDYLNDPSPGCALVLVAGGGQTSRPLLEAVKRHGRIVDAGVPSGRARQEWFGSRLRDAPVRLDAAAAALLAEHLGEDVERLSSLVEMLVAAFGENARLGPDQITPLLGEAGAGAPWDLTDAIDRGDTPAALSHLHRLLGPGGRHPLVVMATLHNHFTRILRLQGADISDETSAAKALGMTGSTYPAKKALAQARRLGFQDITRAMAVLSEADLALKGAVEWPPELVMEVLVARLSRLGPRSGAARATTARRGTGSGQGRGRGRGR